MRTNKVESLIRQCAESRLPNKYRLPQYREGGKLHNEYIKAKTHKEVCEQIVAFMQSHPTYPFTFSIACACQKDAHKESAFHKGYKTFDGTKVEKVYTMCHLYMEYNGCPNKKPSDVVWRLMMRFYENVSTDIEVFKTALSKSKKLGRRCGSRDMKYSVLCDNLGMVFYDYVLEDGISLEDMQKKAV